MTKSTIRPGLTAAMRVSRDLFAAGWVYDLRTEMADGTTIRDLLHPSGREIHARTSSDGEHTELTMTGLTLEQVADAITAAGLTAEPGQPGDVEAALAAEHAMVIPAETVAAALAGTSTGDTPADTTPTLQVHAQISPDEPSEVERLRARVAELEAAQATKGGAR